MKNNFYIQRTPLVPSRVRQTFVDRYLEQLAKSGRLTEESAEEVVNRVVLTEKKMFANSTNPQTYRGLCAAEFRTLRKAIEEEQKANEKDESKDKNVEEKKNQ